MKPFKSFLAPKLNEFLTYRETLGYSLRTIRYHLLLFDRYVMEKNAGFTSLDLRFRLAQKAFGHTAVYDRTIADFLASRDQGEVKGCYSN